MIKLISFFPQSCLSSKLKTNGKFSNDVSGRQKKCAMLWAVLLISFSFICVKGGKKGQKKKKTLKMKTKMNLVVEERVKRPSFENSFKIIFFKMSTKKKTKNKNKL